MSGRRARILGRTALAAACGAAALCVGTLSSAWAQNALGTGRALDANPRHNSGGYNTTSRRLPVQRDIYMVDSQTGAMTYNENNAFAQQSYDWRAPGPTDSAFRRPVAIPTTGSPSDIFTVDRRTGAVRYDSSAAFTRPRFDPRTPPPDPSPLEPRRARPTIPGTGLPEPATSRPPSAGRAPSAPPPIVLHPARPEPRATPAPAAASAPSPAPAQGTIIQAPRYRPSGVRIAGQ